MPTTVLHRRSCGCTSLEDLLAGDGADESDLASWRTALTNQLVELVLYPMPLDPAIPPAQVWPGPSTLVATLDSALRELHAAMTVLEDAAE